MANKNIIKLNKYLDFVLGRCPDRFGLIPDEQGYVKIKELFKVFSEDKDMGHITRANLNEILLTLPDPAVEMDDTRIRAVNRDLLPKTAYAEDPPKLLFTCVRNRAYPVIFERGIEPVEKRPVILAKDEATALKLGKRKDPAPVLLTVNVARAHDLGVLFSIYGETLYLADFLPKNCISGPPLPKEDPLLAQKKEREKERKKAALTGDHYHPGSFFPDFSMDQWDPVKKKKKKRDIQEKKLEKKKEIRERRKEKNKMFER